MTRRASDHVTNPERLPPLRLHLPAELRAVDKARGAVLHHLEPLRLPARVVFAIELVLEEALMNIATHAFADDAAHAIELTVEAEPAQIVLRFVDSGAKFDPTQAPPPVRPATIEQAEPGGLGLVLVRRYARHLAYERRAGRNHLTIAIGRD